MHILAKFMVRKINDLTEQVNVIICNKCRYLMVQINYSYFINLFHNWVNTKLKYYYEMSVTVVNFYLHIQDV